MASHGSTGNPYRFGLKSHAVLLHMFAILRERRKIRVRVLVQFRLANYVSLAFDYVDGKRKSTA
jgi:hypothetical protein